MYTNNKQNFVFLDVFLFLIVFCETSCPLDSSTLFLVELHSQLHSKSCCLKSHSWTVLSRCRTRILWRIPDVTSPIPMVWFGTGSRRPIFTHGASGCLLSNVWSWSEETNFCPKTDVIQHTEPYPLVCRAGDHRCSLDIWYSKSKMKQVWGLVFWRISSLSFPTSGLDILIQSNGFVF